MTVSVASSPIAFRCPLWARMVFALLLTIGASFGAKASAVESISDRVDAVSTSIDEKLVNDSRTGVATDEVTKNAKWIFWLLWLVTPGLVYGLLIPFVIMKAKANDMDAVKTGVVALILGSVLYFGALAVFYG